VSSDDSESAVSIFMVNEFGSGGCLFSHHEDKCTMLLQKRRNKPAVLHGVT